MIVALSQLSSILLIICFLIKLLVYAQIKSKGGSAFFWHDRVELRHTDSSKDKSWKSLSNKVSIVIALLGLCTLFLFLFKLLTHH
jgi:hypothetical protein